MKKLFENWRKHLNEEDYGIDTQPAPMGPHEDFFATTLEAFKEEHPELSIGEMAFDANDYLYIQFDGKYEKVTNDDGTKIRDEEALYQYLRKKAGYKVSKRSRDQKKILKEWNYYLEEKDDFDSEGNLIEENFDEPLNEAIFGGVGMLLLGKLFVFLFKALQSKDELKKLDNTLQQSNAPDGAKEISAKALELLSTVERNAPALEKVAQASGLGGNLNPLNWKTNALIALSSGAIKKMYGKEDDDISLPEPEGS